MPDPSPAAGRHGPGEQRGLTEPVWLIRRGREWAPANCSGVIPAYREIPADGDFTLWEGESWEPMVRESRLREAEAEIERLRLVASEAADARQGEIVEAIEKARDSIAKPCDLRDGLNHALSLARSAGAGAREGGDGNG